MSRELLKRCKDFMDCIDLPRPEKLYAALDAELSNPEPDPEPVAWIEVGHPMDGPYDCHFMAILPKGKHHVYTTPPDQSARIAELLEALEKVIADLKLRAEIDSRGYRVLNISDGVLMRAEKAIAKAKGEL